MVEFHKIYKPLTAVPFRKDSTYAEYEPCEALRPYVRCFWGTCEKVSRQRETDFLGETNSREKDGKQLVIPDTCMDIIFKIDHKKSLVESKFCGVDDRAFQGTAVAEGEQVSTFAIRFYAWSVALFADDSMKEVKNGSFDLEQYFSGIKREIEPILFEITDIKDRMKRTEEYLLKHISVKMGYPMFLQATGHILDKKGNVNIALLARDTGIGSRQLERVFKEYIGLSPKRFASLIRYQQVWRDLLFSNTFDVQDAVLRYGYTDQAHLLHEFKRYHTMSLQKAREYALKDVVFLQEKV